MWNLWKPNSLRGFTKTDKNNDQINLLVVHFQNPGKSSEWELETTRFSLESPLFLDFHWRPPDWLLLKTSSFSLETPYFRKRPQIFHWRLQIFIGNSQILIGGPRFSDFRPPAFHWRPQDFHWRPLIFTGKASSRAFKVLGNNCFLYYLPWFTLCPLKPPWQPLFWKNIDTFFNYVKVNYSIVNTFSY